MFRRVLSLSAAVLALLGVTGMPGQLSARPTRAAAVRPRTTPQVRRVSPSTSRRVTTSRTSRRVMTPRTTRGMTPRTTRRVTTSRTTRRVMTPRTSRRVMTHRFSRVRPRVARRVRTPRFGRGGTGLGSGLSPSSFPTGAGSGLSPSSLSPGAGNPYLGGAPTLGASPLSGGDSSLSPYGSSGGYGGSPDSLGTAGPDTEDTGEARLPPEDANQKRDREMASDLERARKNPPATEIWSGKSLNDLLRSIQNSKPNPSTSPALSEDTLKQITLSDGTSHGNVGLLKHGGNLDWPEFLKEPPFAKARTRLSRNLRRAVGQLQRSEPLTPAQLRDINADFTELNKTFNHGAGDSSPSRYIESKRYLNQLGDAIKALSSPKAANYFNHTWSAKGRNVAELVAHMSKQGLTFGQAAPGDEAAYNALYLSLRNYEASLQVAEK
jgi:hypothetical protein